MQTATALHCAAPSCPELLAHAGHCARHAQRQRASVLTPKARLYLALRRLDAVDTLPDDVAERLANAINTIAREYALRQQTQRVPLVGRISA